MQVWEEDDVNVDADVADANERGHGDTCQYCGFSLTELEAEFGTICDDCLELLEVD